MANIGFIGIGIMGAPMAGHLIAGGHTVHTFTHGATPAALLEAGAKACASGAASAGISTPDSHARPVADFSVAGSSPSSSARASLNCTQAGAGDGSGFQGT
jgi:pyrroline-5-carboxylate reductase